MGHGCLLMAREGLSREGLLGGANVSTSDHEAYVGVYRYDDPVVYL
jgi:hypothetical protein